MAKPELNEGPKQAPIPWKGRYRVVLGCLAVVTIMSAIAGNPGTAIMCGVMLLWTFGFYKDDQSGDPSFPGWAGTLARWLDDEIQENTQKDPFELEAEALCVKIAARKSPLLDGYVEQIRLMVEIRKKLVPLTGAVTEGVVEKLRTGLRSEIQAVKARIKASPSNAPVLNGLKDQLVLMERREALLARAVERQEHVAVEVGRIEQQFALLRDEVLLRGPEQAGLQDSLNAVRRTMDELMLWADSNEDLAELLTSESRGVHARNRTVGARVESA